MTDYLLMLKKVEYEYDPITKKYTKKSTGKGKKIKITFPKTQAYKPMKITAPTIKAPAAPPRRKKRLQLLDSKRTMRIKV
jgi:hypothetical protein